MSSWINDGAAVSNHGFLDSNNATLDPSFMSNNNSGFDPSQFQNQQIQQRVVNGTNGVRNGTASPAFNLPSYQTNSVVPSKRPRPREDSLGTSPRQSAGMLPHSRSQTPQQGAFPNFTAGANPAQPPQQSPYSHLQNGSANASPSPIMSNQLRPGGVPQRVSTASPHPFSPAVQQFPQGSPPQSEQGGSRADTPQNNGTFQQNSNFNPNYNPNFAPQSGRLTGPPQNQMAMQNMQRMQQSQMYSQGQAPPGGAPGIEQQKILYQMKLAQQLQSQNAMAAQRGGMPSGMSPLAKGSMPGQNGQYPAGRPQQPAQSRSGLTPEAFMKNLQTFMQSKNQSIDPNPLVGDRPIALATLYMTVVKFGGYKRVTAQNGWSQVAQAMQLNPAQIPTAPQQLKGHYERNLVMFEEAWQLSQQQRQRQAMMQQNPSMMASAGMSPVNAMNPQLGMQQSQNIMQQQQMAQQAQLQQSHPQGTPAKKMSMSQPPAVNGFSTPQPPQAGHARNSLSRTMDSTPPNGSANYIMPSPASAGKPGNLVIASPQVDVRGSQVPPQDLALPTEFVPKVRILDTFGGVELESLKKLGGQLTQYRPDIPSVYDMGVIDIQALTMSLQCGIHSEVRLALDTLIMLSVEARLQLDLRLCDDLVDVLIDCAEDQVELLAEAAAEVSDVMLVTSYEDTIRGCRAEEYTLQEIPEFGSIEYELDRAADKLICITSILRNLSFYETNHPPLSDDLVIKFLCVVIRYLGTRNMLLRTHQNTLDFMKDIIIFLSNLAQTIEIPGREQALCLLHLLLAFAPLPPPSTAGDRVAFSSYDPAIHRYTPCAVDSLAKLFARDEPNRTHYKTIFASDATSSPPYDLLTRTFALAICGLPDEKQDGKSLNLVSLVEQRKPFLMQGLLAAEIVANLAPSHASGVTLSWLTSEDNFPQTLITLVFALCQETTQQAASHQRAPPVIKGVEDVDSLQIITSALGVLRRLVEKSRDPDDSNLPLPTTAFPSKDDLLGALQSKHPRIQGVLIQLCAYAGYGV